MIYGQNVKLLWCNLRTTSNHCAKYLVFITLSSNVFAYAQTHQSLHCSHTHMNVNDDSDQNFRPLVPLNTLKWAFVRGFCAYALNTLHMH